MRGTSLAKEHFGRRAPDRLLQPLARAAPGDGRWITRRHGNHVAM
jgi:hypothetical protein